MTTPTTISVEAIKIDSESGDPLQDSLTERNYEGASDRYLIHRLARQVRNLMNNNGDKRTVDAIVDASRDAYVEHKQQRRAAEKATPPTPSSPPESGTVTRGA